MIHELSVVIPVYNESKSIQLVLEELKTYFSNELSDIKLEIICVNDCSKDNSSEVISKIPDVKLISHLFNKGYGAALKSGIREAKFENILIMDSDGQHSPEYIKAILIQYSLGYEMVVGSRPISNTKKRRVLGKWLLVSFANFLFGYEIPDINSGLRVFKKKSAIKYMHLCSNRFSFTTSITLAFLSEDLEVGYVPIIARARSTGQSHVNFKVALRTILKVIQVAMIFKPMRVLLPLTGFFVILFFISFLIDILQGNIGDSTVLLFVTSILMFTFSLISDQLSSIRREING